MQISVIICQTCFVIKQRTAYDVRISDWSSDVCSSDLFYALAERLLAETSYDIVLFAGADARPGSALSDNPRVKIFDILDIDEFDAVLSNAKIMVGNDSGPKHLAATRGVPTVSVHRSEEHTSELQSLMRTPLAVFRFK